MSPEPAPRRSGRRWPGRRWLSRAARTRAILRSYTFQFALLYVLLLGVSVAILLGFIHWSTAGYMARQTDETIAADINGLAEQYRRRGVSGLTTLIAERVAADPVGATVYLLADSNARPLVGNLDAWPDREPDAAGWIDFRVRPRGVDGRADERGARAQVFALRGGYRLLVGRDIRELAALRRLLGDALAWGLAMTAGLALAGGWLMSAGVARRLEAVNQVSRRIMDGDLSRRVPTTGSGDDFDQLAENLNSMLARIEALMASVRQVSDNIAHDLRTPLTRLRQRLEGLRGSDEIAEIDAAIADADELLATFNALLRIARLESGSRRAGFADLDPAGLLADLAELYEPLAAEQGLTLTVAPAAGPPMLLHGDRDLLFQALANLVDNAIKYTPAGGSVLLSLARGAEGVEIRIADTGPGIPEPLRGRVFERFFRLDDSRAAPGNGLGLSLVAAVAQLHGARIALEDTRPPPGLTARLVFPVGN